MFSGLGFANKRHVESKYRLNWRDGLDRLSDRYIFYVRLEEGINRAHHLVSYRSNLSAYFPKEDIESGVSVAAIRSLLRCPATQ